MKSKITYGYVQCMVEFTYYFSFGFFGMFMLRFLLFTFFTFFSVQVVAQSYILGVVPQQSPLILYKKWMPVVNYLSSATGLDIQFRTEKSIVEFEKSLYAGKYDLAYMSPYHYVIANKKQGYQSVVRRKKDIKGILVAPHESSEDAINSNTTFLFPSANAFAATLVMKYELLEKYGLDLNKTQNFKYVNSHDSVYKGVARNFGGLGGGVQRTFDNLNSEDDKKKLKILYVTKGYPSHPIAIKPTMLADDKNILVEAMLSMPVEILSTLSMEEIKIVDDAEYDVIRELSKRLKVE